MALTTLSVRWSPKIIWEPPANTQGADPPTLGTRWAPKLVWGSPSYRDTSPPSIAFLTAPGVIDPGDSLTVRITDAGGFVDDPAGLSSITVYAEHAGGLELVAVIRLVDGAVDTVDVNDPYSAGLVVTPLGAEGFDVEVERTGGWPWDVTLHATVADRSGNPAHGSAAYTLSSAPSAPTVGFDPASGASFAYDTATPVRVDVLDAGTVAAVRIIMLGSTRAELVFDDAPGQPAEPGYTIVQSAIPGGRRFDIERVDGWLEDFVLVVEATNAAGLSASDSASYTLTSLPTGGDLVPPISTNIQPPAGTPITASTPVSVDVTDDSGLFRRVLIAVELRGLTELAWDGDQWLGHYAGGDSIRSPITGGFRFVVLRDGGWTSSPTLRVFAFDQGGNEV